MTAPKKVCIVEDCDKPSRKREMCESHYNAARYRERKTEPRRKGEYRALHKTKVTPWRFT